MIEEKEPKTIENKVKTYKTSYAGKPVIAVDITAGELFSSNNKKHIRGIPSCSVPLARLSREYPDEVRVTFFSKGKMKNYDARIFTAFCMNNIEKNTKLTFYYTNYRNIENGQNLVQKTAQKTADFLSGKLDKNIFDELYDPDRENPRIF